MPAPSLTSVPSSLLRSLTSVLDAALWPFETVTSHLLVAVHAGVTGLGADPASVGAWTLALVGVVVVVRLAMAPLVVRQVRTSQRMAALTPQLRAVRERYRGRTDASSLASMRAESAAVTAGAGANPLGCLPAMVQLPVLLSLFRVLSGAAHGEAVGAMTSGLVAQLDAASLGGASLAATWATSGVSAMFAAGLMAVMAAAVWFQQRRQLARNTSEAALEGVAGSSARAMVWLLPLLVVVPGVSVPLGVLLYWTLSSLWSLGQAGALLRWMPTPGTPAAAARDARRAQRGPRPAP